MSEVKICPECGNVVHEISEFLSWEGWAIDTISGVIEVEGVKIRVTPDIGELFTLLIAFKGKLLSGPVIYEKIYRSKNRKPQFKIIVIRIHMLRAILATAGFPSAIKTYWGRGYSLLPVVQAKNALVGKHWSRK